MTIRVHAGEHGMRTLKDLGRETADASGPQQLL